jgi:predicted RNase H-like HicB family nuclease
LLKCPGIIGPCCHGPNEAQAFAELCQIVDEWIEILQKESKPLPAPTVGRNVAQRLLETA